MFVRHHPIFMNQFLAGSDRVGSQRFESNWWFQLLKIYFLWRGVKRFVWWQRSLSQDKNRCFVFIVETQLAHFAPVWCANSCQKTYPQQQYGYSQWIARLVSKVVKKSLPLSTLLWGQGNEALERFSMVRFHQTAMVKPTVEYNNRLLIKISLKQIGKLFQKQ